MATGNRYRERPLAAFTPGSERTVTVPVQMTRDEVEMVDRLAVRLGYGGRSALLRAGAGLIARQDSLTRDQLIVSAVETLTAALATAELPGAPVGPVKAATPSPALMACDADDGDAPCPNRASWSILSRKYGTVRLCRFCAEDKRWARSTKTPIMA